MPNIKRISLHVLLTSAVSIVVLVSLACGSAGADGTPGTSSGTPGSQQISRTGPSLELVGIADWINSEPLSVQDQLRKGNVVLIDFWTYTCVNCIRTLPFLKEWHDKYADRGLVIIGVHSPEFDFEKDLENVKAAVEREGVTWPVALDSDMRTWQAFGNRFWPAKYLIAPDQAFDFNHFGEGAYVETEEAIRAALEATGRDVSDIPVGTVNESALDPDADRITREIYAGYRFNYGSQGGVYSGDDEYYISPDTTRLYEDDGEYVPQQFFLNGEWTNGPEAIKHARETQELTDYIALLISARSANVVVRPDGTEEFRVYVTLDDKPLTSDEAGDDILFDEEDRSYFIVDSARMYRIVEQPEFGERLLKLSSTSDNFAVFAFTFGIYEEGF